VKLLSDNGLAFTGKHRGWMVELERRLAELDVTSIASTPHHPQTCGKNERLHQTLQKWLAARPPAENLAALQQLLDEYRQVCNNRRHQSLGGQTPQQRYDARPKAIPTSAPRRPSGVTTRPVSATGAIAFSGCSIVLGRTWAGHTATVYWQGDRVTGQHVHDRGEHRTSIHRSGAAALRARLEHRDQRLRRRPQLVRNQPQRQPINHSQIIAQRLITM
jgi:hypothetical protein